MITVVAMVTPVLPARVEIRRMGRAGELRLRRCCGRIDCRRAENHERTCDKSCRNPAPHDGLLLQIIQIAGSNLAEFVAARKTKQARNEAGLFVRARLPHSPAAPVTVMMAMVVMMPAVPTMMMMVMMAVVSPVHFRCRQPGVFLNRRRCAGIAERKRIRALGWGCKRKQCANGRKPQNFRYLHMWSPSVAGIAPASNGSIK